MNEKELKVESLHLKFFWRMEVRDNIRSEDSCGLDYTSPPGSLPFSDFHSSVRVGSYPLVPGLEYRHLHSFLSTCLSLSGTFPLLPAPTGSPGLQEPEATAQPLPRAPVNR